MLLNFVNLIFVINCVFFVVVVGSGLDFLLFLSLVMEVGDVMVSYF